MINRYTTPSTRAQFEQRLHLVREALKNQKLFFTKEASRSIDGLRRLRYLPNHRIDLLTVDEATRLTANMMVEMANSAQSLKTGDNPEPLRDGSSTITKNNSEET